MASTYERLLARQRTDVTNGLFAATRQLRYSAERLAAERQRRLRDLLAVADQRPFYRKRLAAAGIDPATATEADLERIQPLTKPEMMANFDDIVDPALTLSAVESHLHQLNGDGYLAGRYRALATGGSSGIRGVVVYGWNDWINLLLLQMRWSVRRPSPAGTVGSVFTRKVEHISGALHAFCDDPDNPVRHLSPTMPVADIVRGLNEAQPVKLQGYPTVISVLAGEASAGRLRIAPAEISTCGERLTDDVRQAARNAWNTEIFDIWGCTEGVYAYDCGVGDGLHIPDDLVIIEPVDDDHRPVPHGQRGTKVLLTNLYNTTQPLIRYELCDSMRLVDEACGCGCAHRRIREIGGDLYDVFHFPSGVVVHTMGLYEVLTNAQQITEYQVLQTTGGATVKVRVEGRQDLEWLRRKLVQVMAKSGLHKPEVTVERVDALDRLWSGKLRRFVQLGGSAFEQPAELVGSAL